MRLPLLATALSLAFAPAQFPRSDRRGAAPDDATALQSEWRMVRCVSNGVTSPGTDEAAITIQGDRLSFPKHDFATTLDTQRRPKSMELEGLSGAFRGHRLIFLYRLE